MTVIAAVVLVWLLGNVVFVLLRFRATADRRRPVAVAAQAVDAAARPALAPSVDAPARATVPVQRAAAARRAAAVVPAQSRGDADRGAFTVPG